MAGLVMGHLSASVKHVADGVRLEQLEKIADLCDSHVMRCEKQREDDREAYFRECNK